MNKKTFLQIIFFSILFFSLTGCGNKNNNDQDGYPKEEVEWDETDEEDEIVMDVIFIPKENHNKEKYIGWDFTLKTTSGKYVPFDNEGDYANYARLSQIANEISLYQGDESDLVQYVFDHELPTDFYHRYESEYNNFPIYLVKHPELLPKVRTYYIDLLKNIELYINGNKSDIDRETFRKIDKTYYDRRQYFNQPSLVDFSYGRKVYRVLGNTWVHSNDYYDNEEYFDEKMNKISGEFVIIRRTF